MSGNYNGKSPLPNPPLGDISGSFTQVPQRTWWGGGGRFAK